MSDADQVSPAEHPRSGNVHADDGDEPEADSGAPHRKRQKVDTEERMELIDLEESDADSEPTVAASTHPLPEPPQAVADDPGGAHAQPRPIASNAALVIDLESAMGSENDAADGEVDGGDDGGQGEDEADVVGAGTTGPGEDEDVDVDISAMEEGEQDDSADGADDNADEDEDEERDAGADGEAERQHAHGADTGPEESESEEGEPPVKLVRGSVTADTQPPAAEADADGAGADAGMDEAAEGDTTPGGGQTDAEPAPAPAAAPAGGGSGGGGEGEPGPSVRGGGKGVSGRCSEHACWYRRALENSKLEVQQLKRVLEARAAEYTAALRQRDAVYEEETRRQTTEVRKLSKQLEKLREMYSRVPA